MIIFNLGRSVVGHDARRGVGGDDPIHARAGSNPGQKGGTDP